MQWLTAQTLESVAGRSGSGFFLLSLSFSICVDKNTYFIRVALETELGTQYDLKAWNTVLSKWHLLLIISNRIQFKNIIDKIFWYKNILAVIILVVIMCDLFKEIPEHILYTSKKNRIGESCQIFPNSFIGSLPF